MPIPQARARLRSPWGYSTVPPNDVSSQVILSPPNTFAKLLLPVQYCTAQARRRARRVRRGAREDPMPGQCYFVRHGESTSNETNIFAGVLDVDLTSFGRLQAQRAGKDMKKKGLLMFDAVYVSHLKRARRTLAVACHSAGLVPSADPESVETWPEELRPHVDYRIAERSFGIFSRRNKMLLRQALGHHTFEHLLHSPFAAPPTAETIDSIYRRCAEFDAEVIQPHLSRGETILVVSHQYTLEAMAVHLAGLPSSAYYSFSLPNGKAMSIEDMGKYRVASTSPVQMRIDAFGDHVTLVATKLNLACFLLGEYQGEVKGGGGDRADVWMLVRAQAHCCARLPGARQCPHGC